MLLLHRHSFACWLLMTLSLLGSVQGLVQAEPPQPSRTPLVRVVDLNVSESQEVELCDGKKARVKLVELEEVRDAVRSAVREARVKVEVNGQPITLTSATYHVPVTIAGLRIDCPITRGYLPLANLPASVPAAAVPNESFESFR